MGSSTSSFVWDLSSKLPMVIQDSSAGGTSYAYGAQGLAELGRSTGTYYYLLDALGSVISVRDSSGSEVLGYSYDVYGTATPTNSTFVNELQYAGQLR